MLIILSIISNNDQYVSYFLLYNCVPILGMEHCQPTVINILDIPLVSSVNVFDANYAQPNAAIRADIDAFYEYLRQKFPER